MIWHAIEPARQQPIGGNGRGVPGLLRNEAPGNRRGSGGNRHGAGWGIPLLCIFGPVGEGDGCGTGLFSLGAEQGLPVRPRHRLSFTPLQER